jgi:hypothetical protein
VNSCRDLRCSVRCQPAPTQQCLTTINLVENVSSAAASKQLFVNIYCGSRALNAARLIGCALTPTGGAHLARAAACLRCVYSASLCKSAPKCHSRVLRGWPKCASAPFFSHANFERSNKPKDTHCARSKVKSACLSKQNWIMLV